MKLLKITMLLTVLYCVPVFCQETISGSIKGKVFDKATKQPVIGAVITIKGWGSGAVTDTSGLFIFTSIPEGNYFLIVNSMGYEEKTIGDVNVVSNKTYYIETEIQETQHSLDEVKVSSFKYENSPLTPVSSYSFSREEISLNPGAQGDIFRAIGMLPGVSSSGGEYSAIAVRGQGVRDNVYIVDDIPVTEVGHLEGNNSFNDPNGGRFSIFAPRVIDNAQFQGGGFGPEYGRRSASYLGLGIKEGNHESPTIDGQADLLGLTVNYDGPSYAFKNTSMFISARYQDFSALVNLIGVKDIGLPRYGDFIFKSITDLNKKNKLSLILIIAPESYVRDVSNVAEDKKLNDLAIINATTNKTIVGLNLRTLVNKNSYWKNILYYTRTKTDAFSGLAYPQTDSNGDLLNANTIPFESAIQSEHYSESKIGYRSIYTVHFHNKSQLTAGVDLDGIQLINKMVQTRPDTQFVFGLNSYRPDTSQYYSVVAPGYVNSSFNKISFDVSGYVNYSFLLLRSFTINAGLRYDYTGFANQSVIAPRISGSYQLSEKSSINFAAGIYYQDPAYRDIANQGTGKTLNDEKVTAYIVSYKKYFTPDLKFTIEGWYKTFNDLIVSPVSGYNFQNNAGTGWGEGIDLNITKRLTKRVHGQIGYSYMKSRRDDHDGQGVYNFAFSQPNQANLLFSYKTDKHWILSTKFRYATGKPTDNYVIHANIFNDPAYIRYSQQIIGKNAARLPDFMSWDVRINYRMNFKKLSLIAFVDVVDVLNRQIANGNQFNPITGQTYYDGISIFPTFGVKFEY